MLILDRLPAIQIHHIRSFIQYNHTIRQEGEDHQRLSAQQLRQQENRLIAG